MTLILALLSKEGIVLSSDGQSTEVTSGQPIKGKTDKIFSIGTSALWAAAGDVGAMQEIAAEINKLGSSAKGQFMQLRSAFVDAVFNVNEPRHTRFMKMYPTVVPGIQSPPIAKVLFAQYEGQQPHIVEISENGSATNCEIIGHQAIGSGDVFAKSNLWGYKPQDLSLDQAKILAYMTVKKAVEIAAFGLGPPIDLWTLTKKSGQVTIVRASDTEKETVEDTVNTIMNAQLDVFTGRPRQ